VSDRVDTQHAMLYQKVTQTCAAVPRPAVSQFNPTAYVHTHHPRFLNASTHAHMRARVAVQAHTHAHAGAHPSCEPSSRPAGAPGSSTPPCCEGRGQCGVMAGTRVAKACDRPGRPKAVLHWPKGEHTHMRCRMCVFQASSSHAPAAIAGQPHAPLPSASPPALRTSRQSTCRAGSAPQRHSLAARSAWGTTTDCDGTPPCVPQWWPAFWAAWRRAAQFDGRFAAHAVVMQLPRSVAAQPIPL
jgi:hypothetical protein